MLNIKKKMKLQKSILFKLKNGKKELRNTEKDKKAVKKLLAMIFSEKKKWIREMNLWLLNPGKDKSKNLQPITRTLLTKMLLLQSL